MLAFKNYYLFNLNNIYNNNFKNNLHIEIDKNLKLNKLHYHYFNSNDNLNKMIHIIIHTTIHKFSYTHTKYKYIKIRIQGYQRIDTFARYHIAKSFCKL